MKIESLAFSNGGMIPDKYSKDGGDISPPLSWAEAPDRTRSLALVMDDPDAPNGTFVHWTVYNIPAATKQIPEGASGHAMKGARQGRNSFGKAGYGGPKPPSGTHRYFFHLFALDSEIDLPDGATREQLDAAMRGHVIEECEHMGKYQHR